MFSLDLQEYSSQLISVRTSFNIGKTGSIISAGNITFMSMTVGFKVLTGIGFLLLLMLGILPAREYDIFDKEDGGHKEYWENVKAQAKEDDLV